MAFDTDLTPSGAVGIYRYDRGHILEIAKSGGAAPGGGTFKFPITMSMNGSGDVAFTGLLEPGGLLPRGAGAGVYAYSSRTGSLRAVLTPGVTRAPGGGVFRGVNVHEEINDNGVVSFPGLHPTPHGIPGNPSGLGSGIFRADPDGRIAGLAVPGDPAPGGVLDFAYNATINERGDVAFGGHILGEECVDNPADEKVIHCRTGVYTRRAGGPITTVAHRGDPAPKGGIYRQAHTANIDRWGNVVFIGDLTPPPEEFGAYTGVYLYMAALGSVFPIVRPGDALPGGGHLKSVHFDVGSKYLSDWGQITIPAFLDTFTNGVRDEGIYVWSLGTLHLVARTGTVIPGIGKIASFASASGYGNVAQNNLGQLSFRARLDDGRFIVLLASPHGFVD
ncbi:hypothetical protein LZC95_25550 [Pendulispora brunnea]|uniref:Uncharacterized protein n=1 Tax=Pendulispora brunnea TaxID=2905690 RepID=A0ABZ2KNQ7_9BACT